MESTKEKAAELELVMLLSPIIDKYGRPLVGEIIKKLSNVLLKDNLGEISKERESFSQAFRRSHYK